MYGLIKTFRPSWTLALTSRSNPLPITSFPENTDPLGIWCTALPHRRAQNDPGHLSTELWPKMGTPFTKTVFAKRMAVSPICTALRSGPRSLGLRRLPGWRQNRRPNKLRHLLAPHAYSPISGSICTKKNPLQALLQHPLFSRKFTPAHAGTPIIAVNHLRKIF